MKKKLIPILISTLSFIQVFAQSSSFSGLGDFAGGAFSSEALNVSDDGSIVVGDGTSAQGAQAFIWTEKSGMLSLGNVADKSFKTTMASEISADGKTVVGHGDTIKVAGPYADRQGFIWTDAGGMKKFGSLNSSPRYRVDAVSEDGTVIAGVAGSEAFYWTKSNGIKGLGYLTGNNRSEIVALSADGSVAVGQSYTDSKNNNEAIRWTEKEGMIGLGFLPGHTTSFCNTISPDGSVICGTSYLSSRAFAFRWTKEKGMVDIGTLPGKNTMHPTGASINGKIIVGVGYDDSFNFQAFIWDSIHGMQDLKTVLQTKYGLNLTGWNLNVAYDITPDGKVIVGYGKNPSGKQEAFRAYLSSPITDAKTVTKNKNIELFPNPTTGLLTISFGTNPPKKAIASIFNTEGKLVTTKTFRNTTNATIDLKGQTKGMYLLRLTENGKIFSDKFYLE